MKWISAKSDSPKRYHTDENCPAFPSKAREVTEDDERRGVMKCKHCIAGVEGSHTSLVEELREVKELVPMRRCDDCSEEWFIAPYGTTASPFAIVGYQPIEGHPDESDAVFGLDLDRRVRSGKVLERVGDELDVSLDDWYWTNAYKCPDQSPDACLDLLADELSKFSTVIVLGNDARNALHEANIEYDHSLWHPAYVMRQENRFDEYVEMWREATDTDGQNTLSQFG